MGLGIGEAYQKDESPGRSTGLSEVVARDRSLLRCPPAVTRPASMRQRIGFPFSVAPDLSYARPERVPPSSARVNREPYSRPATAPIYVGGLNTLEYTAFREGRGVLEKAWIEGVWSTAKGHGRLRLTCSRQ